MTVASAGDTGRSISLPKPKKAEPKPVKKRCFDLPSVPELHGEYIEVYRPVITEADIYEIEKLAEEIDLGATIREVQIDRVNGESIRMLPLPKAEDVLRDLREIQDK